MIFVKSMTCALDIAKTSCPFHDLELNVGNDKYREEKSREAYIKGRIDILCSLAGYQFISSEVGAYMAGMSKQSFEKVLQDWQYEWMDDVDE